MTWETITTSSWFNCSSLLEGGRLDGLAMDQEVLFYVACVKLLWIILTFVKICTNSIENLCCKCVGVSEGAIEMFPKRFECYSLFHI